MPCRANLKIRGRQSNWRLGRRVYQDADDDHDDDDESEGLGSLKTPHSLALAGRVMADDARHSPPLSPLLTPRNKIPPTHAAAPRPRAALMMEGRGQEEK
eukprot:1934312-Rhodomonas_salina.1